MKPILCLATLALIGACTGVTPLVPDLSGEQLYARNCAACHGPAAEGDGPVAGVMSINVPNLRGLAERNNGMFPRVTVREYIDGRRLAAAHGDRYMPVWGDEFRSMMDGSSRSAAAAADARIESLTDFIASIQYGARN